MVNFHQGYWETKIYCTNNLTAGVGREDRKTTRYIILTLDMTRRQYFIRLVVPCLFRASPTSYINIRVLGHPQKKRKNTDIILYLDGRPCIIYSVV